VATRFELSLPDWASESLAAAPPQLDDEARMRWVIELARTNFERDTGGPFAAAVFEEGTGRVVSIGVNRVVPGSCSSAHAEVMALSLAAHGIRVNGIGPGTILTELAKTAVLGNRESERKILSRTPMGRMGEPDEIAQVAVFLASDAASYMTGQTLYPDGGRLAFLAYEAVTRRKPNARVEANIHAFGLMLLIALITVVTFRGN